jgi:putative sigma-54 modulation protein
MVINITGRHVEITDAIRGHVEGRLAGVMDEFPRIQSIHVVLNHEKQHRNIAEIVVQAPGPGTVGTREESHDMYVSIDAAVEKVAIQMRKWFDRVQDHHKGQGHRGPTAPAKA